MSWTDRAECKGRPLEWFFPTTGLPPAEAVELCARCPVREECAREGKREMGLWAGRYRGERNSRRYQVEVRCDRCGGVFARAARSTDLRCDSCLTPEGVLKRRARDLRRVARAQEAYPSIEAQASCVTVSA